MNILDADDDEDLAVASASMLVCGVYEIADAFGRSYIGSSVNIYRRWEEHRRELVAGNHHAH
jgi:predicted GIY-YIG superfamily endonuclease